ncbi:MAG: M1 family metallopeptidase [Propionibacteriales bacterium]|nr:M1 family metallopeptidase [Propionibacteriales bacterium]
MRWRTVLVVILLLLVPGFSGAAATDFRDSGAPVAGSIKGPDPYWPFDGNGGTNALHYDVRVFYNFEEKILAGRTIITMRATTDLSSFSLDLLLPTSSVKVNGKAALFSRPNHHELKVVPKTAIASGATFKVDVSYRGRPAPISYAGERNWLANRHEVVTMNQPHMSPWWFPANDHPSDKATFDIRVNVPKTKEVISNGTRISRTTTATRATTRWRMYDPMATYLAFFAAGDFVIEKGRSSSGIPYYNAVSSRLPTIDRNRSLRELRRTAGITEWLKSRLGPYPFTSTGGVVTSLDVGFALENQTRPTYGAWIYPGVVVHELAHQWFGDSVAVERWSDIWLNEGFATYAEAYYAASHGGPSIESWLNNLYDETCQAPFSSFWTLDLDDPGAAHIFDSAVYDRGAMVLGALRNRVGAVGMRDLLRAWVAEHRDANASVAEFEAFAEAETGEELTAFFNAWLRGGKAPAGTEDNGLEHACP